MNIVACITARTQSKRLPNKALLPICEIETIRFLIRRVKKAKKISKIILCTTCLKEDDALEKIAIEEQIAVFRGQEKNVMNRIIDAVILDDPEWIIRITGDDILVHGREIDMAIKELPKLITLNYQYLNASYPKGKDFQIINYKNFKLVYEKMNFNKDSDTEMISHYLSQNLLGFTYMPDFSLDTPEDYEKLKFLLR